MERSWRAAPLLLRAWLIVLGGGAVAYGCDILFFQSSNAVIEKVAAGILRREPYRPRDLTDLAGRIEDVKQAERSRAQSLRSSAIIELAQVENALAAGRRLAIRDRLDALKMSLLRGLATAPSDPFLWLLLFHQANMADGYRPEWLNYLDRSYQLGPNEGWIALRRNALALAMFPRLPAALAEKAVAEFVGLVRSGFDDAAQILVGPGWTLRDRLLPRLAGIPNQKLQEFVTAVAQQGREIVVPGVKPRESRPWH